MLPFVGLLAAYSYLKPPCALQACSWNQSVSPGHETAIEQLQFDVLGCSWEPGPWYNASSRLLHASWFWYPVGRRFGAFLAQLSLPALTSQYSLFSSLWLLSGEVPVLPLLEWKRCCFSLLIVLLFATSVPSRW